MAHDITRFERAVEDLTARGFSHSKAVRLAARRDPKGHEEFLLKYNPNRKQQETIRKSFQHNQTSN